MSSPVPTTLWLIWSTQLEGLGADANAALADAQHRLAQEHARLSPSEALRSTTPSLTRIRLEIHADAAFTRAFLRELWLGDEVELGWQHSLDRALRGAT